MSAANISISINAKDHASQVMRGLAVSTSKMAGGVKNDMQKLSGIFAATFAGLTTGAGLVGGALLTAGGSVQKMEASLVTAFQGSEEAANQAYSTIENFAKTTPFQLQEVLTGFLKLKNMGLTPSEEALRAYGDTASSMGKSLNDMVEAVADATTGEFERLKEFGIRSQKEGERVTFTFQGVATEVGMSADEIENYLINLGEVNFSGGMKRQSQTLMGQFSTLKDNVTNTFAQISKDSGLLNIATGVLEELNIAFADLDLDSLKNDFQEMTKVIAPFIDEIALIGGIVATVTALSVVVTALSAGFAILSSPLVLVTGFLVAIGLVAKTIFDRFDEISTFVQSNFAPELETLSIIGESVKEVFDGMVAIARPLFGILMIIGTTIASLVVEAFHQLRGPANDMIQAFAGLFEVIGTILMPVIIGLAAIFTAVLLPIIILVANIFIQQFRNMMQFITAGVDIIAGILNVFAGVFEGIFTGNWGRVIEGFKKIGSGLISFVKAMIERVTQPFRVIISSIKSVFRSIDFLAIARGWIDSLVSGISGAAGRIGSVVSNILPNPIKSISNLIPKFATGGDFMTTGPQLIMVGDNPGGQERVTVTPTSSPNINGPRGGSGGSVNITNNYNIQNRSDAEFEARRTAQLISLYS